MFEGEPKLPNEKKVLRNQYIALAIMFLLFFIVALSTILLFEDDFMKVIRVTLTISMLPLLFIGVSSIKNRISIYRPKGQKKHAVEQQAIIMGVIILGAYFLNVLIIFSPILEIFMGN